MTNNVLDVKAQVDTYNTEKAFSLDAIMSLHYSINVKLGELVATMISINCYHSSSRHNGIMDSVTPPAQHRINDTCLQAVCISCLIYILNFSIKYFHKYT